MATIVVNDASVGTTIQTTPGTLQQITLTTPPVAWEHLSVNPSTGFPQSAYLCLTAEGGARSQTLWSSDTLGMQVGLPSLTNGQAQFQSLMCRSSPKGSVWSIVTA
jgi:hypothetical protein